MIDSEIREVFHVVGPINPQEIEKEWIIFHPYSLSLFNAEPTEGKILKLYENKVNIKEIARILKIPEKSVEKTIHDFLERIKVKSPETLHTSTEPESMYINTGKCNLRCKYCYTEGGDYGRNEYALGLDESVIKKALDTLLSIYNINFFVFFGGEPLIDFDTMKRVVKYTEREYGPVTWGIVTNGTLIKKDIIEFFSAHDFQITVSLDGPELVHDSNRVFPNGQGSFSTITNALTQLKENNIPFFIQATYSKEAFYLGHDMITIAKYISTWTDKFVLKPVCSFPLVNSFVDSPVDQGEINTIMKDYLWWALHTLTTDSPVCSESIYQGLFALLKRACRTHTCPQERFISLSPNGDLYTCHLLSHPQFRITNFKKEFNRESIKEKCQNLRINKLFHVHTHHWYWPFQSICPAAFLTEESLYYPENQSMPEKSQNLLSIMWDEFLRAVVTIQQDSVKWNTMVTNLDKKFRRDKDGTGC